jgi:hypothetical protein
VSGVVVSVVSSDAPPVDALPASLVVSGLSGGVIESTPGIDRSGVGAGAGSVESLAGSVACPGVRRG